jgi:hypothetical protein
LRALQIGGKQPDRVPYARNPAAGYGEVEASWFTDYRPIDDEPISLRMYRALNVERWM